MAVWQNRLSIIPEKGILKKYNSIPNKLLIDHDRWGKYWENVIDIENLPDPNFEDAKTIKWWDNINLDINRIIKQVDGLVNRSSWNDREDSGFISWKGNTNKEEDNDGHISFDIETGIISEFEFRTDLRKKDNVTRYLAGMLSLCEQNGLLVYNNNGDLFEPKFELIFEDLKKSNAIHFLTDSEGFLDKITKEEDEKSKEISFWMKIKKLLK